MVVCYRVVCVCFGVLILFRNLWVGTDYSDCLVVYTVLGLIWDLLGM